MPVFSLPRTKATYVHNMCTIYRNTNSMEFLASVTKVDSKTRLIDERFPSEPIRGFSPIITEISCIEA
jgi:hypothetical protein